MSSATGVYYSVAEQAAMREASAMAQELSRLRVLGQRRTELAVQCRVLSTAYGTEVPIPPEVRPRDGETSDALRARVDRLDGAMADAETSVAAVLVEQRSARLNERLRSLAGPEPEAPQRTAPVLKVEPAPPSAKTGSAATFRERIDGYLAALDPSAELSEEIVRLADMLRDKEGGARDEMSARALQHEIGRLNRLQRARRKALERLRELDVRAGSLGPGGSGVQAAVEVAYAAVRDGDEVDLAALSEAIDAAEAEQRASDDRDYVERTLNDIFRDLGYETVEGFDKLVPRGGHLVRRTGWSHHGVMVNVADGEITLDVVRTRAGAEVSDVAAEESFCHDLPTVLGELEESGVHGGRVRSIPPGIVDVPMMGEPEHEVAAQASAARKRKPIEKKL